MSKVKRKSLKEKITEYAYEQVYIKFNFSYISYEEDFSEQYISQFYKRIKEISSEPYMVVTNWPKNKGFEREDKTKLGITKQIPNSFSNRFPSTEYGNKLAIIRLFPNNNPLVARIIGVFIGKIFYILFIDIGGNLYKH